LHCFLPLCRKQKRLFIFFFFTFSTPSFSLMDEAYIGSIVLFAGNFAPRGWAFCDGSILSIAQNAALFSILGVTYGGNGTNNFALPDLRSRVPVHANNGQAGPGQQAVQLGESAGTNTLTLTSANLPQHTHGTLINKTIATTNDPTGGVLAIANYPDPTTGDPIAVNVYAATSAGQAANITPTGAGAPVSNMQPYLGLNYIICLQGLFPSRN
jgi:microcystin-dependent protein